MARPIVPTIVSTKNEMEAQIKKWGNSLALGIPQALAGRIGLKLDSTVDLAALGEKLVISRVEHTRTRLETLLEGMTRDNFHDEVDTGPSVGVRRTGRNVRLNELFREMWELYRKAVREEQANDGG